MIAFRVKQRTQSLLEILILNICKNNDNGKYHLPYTSISHISKIGPVVGESSGASYMVSTITYLAIWLQGIDNLFGGMEGVEVFVVLSV